MLNQIDHNMPFNLVLFYTTKKESVCLSVKYIYLLIFVRFLATKQNNNKK